MHLGFILWQVIYDKTWRLNRIPQTGVDINTEPEFLTCCNCTDDCQDKEKCACWQLTISHTIASNPEAKIHKNAGYQHRRLYETVATGIFECHKMCKCNKTCLNRVAQFPLRAKLQASFFSFLNYNYWCLAWFQTKQSHQSPRLL
jgi:hypothetical protein